MPQDAEPVFDALGRRFVVRCADPEVADHLHLLLAGLRVEPVDGETDLAVLTGDLESASIDQVITALIGTVNLWAVAAAEGQLLLHSGAVADANGATTLLCGPSGSGKSTLTAALVQRDGGYVTDETTCLDPLSLRITPFRKPVSLKPGSFAAMAHLGPEPGSTAERCTGSQWLVPPDALKGADLPAGPLFPTLLVFPTHTSGSPVRIEPVRVAEAAYLLGSNSARLWWATGGSLEAVTRLARRVPAYRVAFDNTEDAVEAIEKLAAEAA